MKIDRTKVKKSNSELSQECKTLIELLKGCSQEELLKELKRITTWTYGKCELYHWADVLDSFDEVLEKACKKEKDGQWVLPCDMEESGQLKELLLQVLQFTALLVEHSFSRHLYNSLDHLTTLLASSHMTIVLGVLNLLYVFSKRSNFINRLGADKKQGLVVRLTHLAESWGGKENGFGLAECCQNLAITSYPPSATTLHFEFYAENKDEKQMKKNVTNSLSCVHIENVDKIQKLPALIMEEILQSFNVPANKQTLLFTHIRLAHAFSRYEKRMQCVHARLQAISILVYSNAIQENVNSLLYSGLIEELVDILELQDESLMEIKAAALRTLTSIIHLDRNPKLNNIIDATGASSYHGFLPVLVRNCIQHMTDPDLTPFPQPFATALFSFLYHLASYENGGEALVSCGMMESLLKVINWLGDGHEHITFVTRAVRVVDLITNLDMAAFQMHAGLTAFINRLEHEVEICRKEQPFVIKPTQTESLAHLESQPSTSGDGSAEVAMETDSDGHPVTHCADNKPKPGVQCFPQRAALLKSMLNFLKKAIPDPAFSDSIRHLMDGSLPRSLKHIISNAEYYGPSLFLLATDVVTVYVFQEPSLLSSLQDNGLTDVVLNALLVKDVPATREVLASLPNVFSALCLNTRGLQSFVACKPFERLFNVLLSPDYLPAMRRRRSSDPIGDTASNLGNAVDELMRHQPSLRTDATKAIIKLLEEVCSMGRDAQFVCQKPQSKTEQPPGVNHLRSPIPNEAASSDDEDEEEELASTNAEPKIVLESADPASATSSSQERTPIPLMDFVLNVMKFVEAILSNNTTDDHCREFVNQKGLVPLMGILGLPNLPIDFPASPSCQSVASVCKSVLTLSHEPQVLKQGLLHLNEVLQSLDPLHKFLDAPGGSVLLRELATAPNLADATLSSQATPLLHALAAAHAYIMMFVHVCRVGQSDIRSISVSHWGSELGLQVLRGLSQLYTSLVWESTVLLALCSEDILPQGCEFGKGDLNKLLPKDIKTSTASKSEDEAQSLSRSCGEMGSNGVSAAMETLSTSETSATNADSVSDELMPMETDDVAGLDSEKKSKLSPTLQAQIKQIKPLLSASSRLGRALAELFGLLVKLSVGSPVRQRRSQQLPPTPTTPTPAARAVASALTKLLANGLKWMPPPASPVPKLRLTFLICSVGFTSPMLFDEKKFPYHLMLQKFVSSSGQDALFEAFHWALSCGGTLQMNEGLEHPSLPDGTGEFLDAWLMLIEKMVNTKNVLESPHTLPSKSTQPGFVPFSALQYLVQTHKLAFQAVMNLWGKKPLKVYGGRMSESILAILCHIIKGEAVIKEKFSKECEEAAAAENLASSALAGSSLPGSSLPSSALPSASLGGASLSTLSSSLPNNTGLPSRREEPEVNADHLQQLMDMGFTREHASEALMSTSNLEQATEYILTHPPPAATPAQTQSTAGMELDLSEEDQMLRAIAMSLGQNVLMSTDQEQKSPDTTEKKEEEEEENDRQRIEEPIEKDVIDQFTENMMPGCLQLLDTLPESVYRVCDLLVVVTSRNGEKWRDETFTRLIAEIAELSVRLLEAAAPLTKSDARGVQDWASQLSDIPEAAKLAARLHLFTLLFEEMKLPCAKIVDACDILDLLVRLLDSAQQCLSAASNATTPKWIAPMLLFLDLYEKVSVASERKAQLDVIVCKNRTWKWFDDRSGRWCNYSISNNKTIDDAYQAGDSSVRFTAGRRRYTVQFTSMVQVNEETGNRRPIMLSLPVKEEKPKSKEENNKEEKKENDTKETTENNLDTESKKEKVAEVKMETEENKSVETTQPQKEIVQALRPDHTTSLIRSMVGLIGIPVDPDTLHAVLRLLLRLTREHEYAMLFVEQGGARLLLNLKQSVAFQSFTSLATLLLRHVLEDPATLRHTMEKVIRSATSGTGSSATGVAQGSMGSKELHYVLRLLGPAACRCPEMFVDVAKSCLRIALPPPSKRDEDESRLQSANTPQILKSLHTKQGPLPQINGNIKEVLYELLNALAVKYPALSEDSGTSEVQPAQTLEQALQDVANEDTHGITSEVQNIIHTDNSDTDDTSQVAGESSASTETAASAAKEAIKTQEELKKSRPLLPKSSIMRLLAELIRSYVGVANMITQHNYTAGQTPLVQEDCSVLAFILDQLLPHGQEGNDKDCPALARVLVASIAACNHSPDAQMILVSEIKSALQRALTLPESNSKHTRIQALTGIVSTVIEACPSPGQIPNQVFKGQQSTMNTMVRMLLKRGLVTDLARIPHSIDLTSPHMAVTINAALKPLETLSRIVNQPQAVLNKSKPKTIPTLSTAEAVVDETAANNPPTEDPGNVNDEGEEEDVGDVHIEDVTENADQHDDLEETEALEAVEPRLGDSQIRVEEELDEVLDQLLDHEEGEDAEHEVVGEILMSSDNPGQMANVDGDVLIDLEVTGDLDNHDSQMVTQNFSDDEAHDNTQVDPHDDDSQDDSDVDDDDDDEDDDDNDDDDHEDDDGENEDEEEEEDDEGSDMEADNDDFADLEEPYMRLHDDNDLFVHMEDMFPPGAGPHVMFGDTAHSHIRTYQLPISVHDVDNGNDAAGPSLPPPPSTVTATHPLLVRHADPHALGGSIAARVHRAGRQRGTYRYNPSTQTLHVHYSAGSARHPNPPAILQRLLGPSTAADVLQLTNTLSQGPGHARVLLANDDLRIFSSRPENDFFEDFLGESFPEGGGGTGVLSTVPSALTRWTEEARVLDGNSMHDCVSVLKPAIIEELEKHRDVEIGERREKRKKTAEEEAAKKEAEKKEKAEKQNGEVNEPSTGVEIATSTSSTVTTSASSLHANEAASEASAERLANAIIVDVLSSPLSAALAGAEPPSSSSGQPPPSSATMTPMQPIPQNTPTAPARNNRLDSCPLIDTPQTNSSVSLQSTSPPLVSSPSASADTPSTQSLSTIDTTVLQVPQPSNPDQEAAASLSPMDTSSSARQDMDNLVSTSNVSSSDTQNSLLNTAMNRGSSSLLTLSSELSLDQTAPPVDPLESADQGSLSSLSGLVFGGDPVPGSLSLLMGDGEAVSLPSTDGLITPEEPSNITSSDAVTIHSSESGSGSSSEAPSTAEAEATSSDQQVAENNSANQSASASIGNAVNATTAATSSHAEVRPPNMFGDIQLPEGVDPSFLAALPDNIRQEVIAEQLRLQRIQQRAQQQNQQSESTGVTEVNPEFLAALPPSIQEEVLAQQRAEQARLSTNTTVSAIPEQNVDPASFISSLPTSLRQQVLADMDDSMVAVLPADLAAEAQLLRRELEERHRRLMQERLFSQGAGPISAILRHSGLASRLGTRYAIRAATQPGWGARAGAFGRSQVVDPSGSSSVRLRGRHMLDHEALTCLVVLLFVDEPRLNTGRLHRVLRNLCYHAQTRVWVIKALLSILQRTSECREGEEWRTMLKNERAHSIEQGKGGEKFKKKSSSSSQTELASTSTSRSAEVLASPAVNYSSATKSTCPTWLSISLDAALGCRANVFQIQRSSTKKHGSSSSLCSPAHVTIHSQASPLVCRHVLDTLISLAKSFPNYFLPGNKAREASAESVGCKSRIGRDSDSKTSVGSGHISPGRGSTAGAKPDARTDIDFWDLLVRLDSTSGCRKGKSVQRAHSNMTVDSDNLATTFESSPLGLLMSMLAHPVIRRSQLLTDRLLRLLGLISIVLPDLNSQLKKQTTEQSGVNANANTTETTSIAVAEIPLPPSTTVSSTVVSCSSIPSIVTTSQPEISVATTASTTATTVTSSVTQENLEASRQDQTLELNETMEISTVPDEYLTSTPLPTKDKDKDKPSVAEPAAEETPVLENQLQLAVEVLTSKSCSEEGLEDATNVLLQLSRANNATRDTVLQLLLAGARSLGLTVCSHIRSLLLELQTLVKKSRDSPDEEDKDLESVAASSQQKGVIAGRYGGSSVVIAAPSKIKGGRELQLPSMTLLTSKTASQQFLLRMLKVIIQLRESANVAARGSHKTAITRDLIGLSDANAVIAEAEAEAMMEMMGHLGARITRQHSRPSAPPSGQADTPMEVDLAASSSAEKAEEASCGMPRLSEQLMLEDLWDTLGECLTELARTPDQHAVLVLQPAVEAFFLVHAGEKDAKPKDSASVRREDQLAHLNIDITAPLSPAPSSSNSQPVLLREDSVASVANITANLPPDTQKFLKFAETHRTVLNQILRQSSTPLADGPFSVLVNHTRVLDFDVKRRYFRQELERMDEGMRREDLAVHVRRDNVFEDSFRELHRRSPEEWKHRFYIVFEGEEGQDAGGLLREWYLIISREIFNPMYALFSTSPGDRVTYTINPSSHFNTNHLSYFKFVGRIIAKAIYDNKLLECYFTRSFYKHILGVLVRYTDMESEDYSFYQGLVFLLENDVKDLGYDLTFSTEIQEFGVTETRDLKPNGANIAVTEDNKKEYVKLVCQMKMTGAIRKQLNAFLEGFYDIIPKRLISIFNEQELELLLSGLPTVDIDDLKANTEYHKYQPTSLQIQWFWRALRSFDQADRARFLQFVTGTSKVPLQGFAHLEGMNGTQKFQIHRDDRSTDRLPCAHTCFNQLDLPAYETYDKLRTMVLLACNECSEGFGLA